VKEISNMKARKLISAKT